MAPLWIANWEIVNRCADRRLPDVRRISLCFVASRLMLAEQRMRQVPLELKHSAGYYSVATGVALHWSRMGNRAHDWFEQAERDLEHARASQEQNRHEWACFAAQQSAEKAVKALHLGLGQEAWGHIIARLLVELPVKTP